jgi:hypothetical protein
MHHKNMHKENWYPIKIIPFFETFARINIFNVIQKYMQVDKSIFSEVIVSAILSRKVYMYMCPIPNGFRGRVISLFFFLPRCSHTWELAPAFGA